MLCGRVVDLVIRSGRPARRGGGLRAAEGRLLLVRAVHVRLELHCELGIQHLGLVLREGWLLLQSLLLLLRLLVLLWVWC